MFSMFFFSAFGFGWPALMCGGFFPPCDTVFVSYPLNPNTFSNKGEKSKIVGKRATHDLYSTFFKQ